jgi:hypothetical protein
LENPVYHVLLEGRRVGPYDRRTIVGMKVKKTLTSKNVLVGADGSRTTVGELVRQALPDHGFAASSHHAASSQQAAPGGAASRPVVQGIHPAQVLEVQGVGYTIPPFQGEVEVRVQGKVLRVSGRFREGSDWKEERVKFPLQDIAHARLRGTIVDLWVRSSDPSGSQRVSLDLLKREAAGELAESLPHAAPYPGSEPLAGRTDAGARGRSSLVWASGVGALVALGTLVAWLFVRGA